MGLIARYLSRPKDYNRMGPNMTTSSHNEGNSFTIYMNSGQKNTTSNGSEESTRGRGPGPGNGRYRGDRFYCPPYDYKLDPKGRYN